MTNEPIEMLVFKDGEGHYYVMPRQAWEHARVPDARRGEVERLLSARPTTETATKIGDLPPRDAASVRGGATASSVQTVGSFKTTSPIGTSVTAQDWDSRA